MTSNLNLYQQVAKETGVSVEMVQEIVQAQSSFIRTTVERGAFESVSLVYLGKIKAKLKYIQYINQNKGRDGSTV